MSETLSLNSEDAAWAALRRLLSGQLKAEDVDLDLSDLTWVSARFAYKGEPFHQTVTPSIMRGLVEFQADIYRCAALILRNDGRVSRLTDAEKSDLEIVFKVDEGSSVSSTGDAGLRL